MWLYLVTLVGLYYLLRWYRERQVVSHLRDKYVFITGCDSGFGNLLARQLDLRGLRVLAACLTEKGAEQLRGQTSDRLETVILDVTKTDSIAAATKWVKEHTGDKESSCSLHWYYTSTSFIFPVFLSAGTDRCVLRSCASYGAKNTKPEGELEMLCNAVLMALVSQSPGMVIDKLWDQLHVHSLPPRSLLAVVKKLTLSEDGASYLLPTWTYVLHHLRMVQEEDDMLTVCQVLSALAISAQKHLGTGNHEVRGTGWKGVSIIAYLTFRILFNRWSFFFN
ncbi:3beta-hydroxysteroid dehydrogenase dhs-16-like isoform X2 [Saccopteryx bilineata]|uniref:3beta-hydroxysteroid dehydrogenase dhs-16-like isoform X2 n=1 Tax=Saccopteryx bilineata TaxID=59482 RepID=UPI00338E6FAE